MASEKDIQYLIKKNEAKKKISYIAPTIYRVANGIDKYAYFKTLSKCLRRYLIATKQMQGKDTGTDGFIKFEGTAPVTMGVNVDFFDYSKDAGVYPLTYEEVKKNITTSSFYYCICRFYKTDGTGPLYAIFHTKNLGIAAQVVKGLTPQKVALLDEYQRQLQVAQSNFNSYTVYINKLKSKKMNKAEFAKFEQAVSMRAGYESALKEFVKEKEIDIDFKNVDKIGLFGVDDIIIVAIIATSLLIAYLVPKLIQSNERIKTVNASYNFQQFIAEQNRQISIDEGAGKYSKAQADELRKNNTQAATKAQQVVTDVVEAAKKESESSFMDQVQNLAILAAGVFIISKFVK